MEKPEGDNEVAEVGLEAAWGQLPSASSMWAMVEMKERLSWQGVCGTGHG